MSQDHPPPAWLEGLRLPNARQTDAGWSYQGPHGPTLVGLGNPSPRVACDYPALQWRPPAWLAELCAWRDGLPLCIHGQPPLPRLLPAHQMVPLSHVMRFGEENILYQPTELLLFGLTPGGAWVTDRSGSCYLWNRTSHEIGPIDYQRCIRLMLRQTLGAYEIETKEDAP